MDKVIDEEVVRFYCDCYDPRHVLELVAERVLGEAQYVEFRPFVCGKSPLRWRLRQVWSLLKGEDVRLSEFLLRREDYVPMAHFILAQMPTTETVSNEYV